MDHRINQELILEWISDRSVIFTMMS